MRDKFTHGTRRVFLLGGIGIALGGSAAAKRRKKKRKRDKKKPQRKKTPRHEAILSDLAARMFHGYRDEGVALNVLERRLAAGERIEALCGTQSELGVRALGRQSIRARVVGALTHEPFTGVADGHIMLEVRLDHRWQLYDLTANAQAIDAKRRGISIVALCEATHRRWRSIAHDPLWSQEQIDAGDVPWIIDPEGWYERVLGTPWVKDTAGYNVFHDPANEARIVDAYPWAFPVDATTWRDLTA